MYICIRVCVCVCVSMQINRQRDLYNHCLLLSSVSIAFGKYIYIYNMRARALICTCVYTYTQYSSLYATLARYTNMTDMLRISFWQFYTYKNIQSQKEGHNITLLLLPLPSRTLMLFH